MTTIYLQLNQEQIDWFEKFDERKDPNSGVLVQTGPAGEDQYFCTVDTTLPYFKEFSRQFHEKFAPFADEPKYTEDPERADYINLYHLLDRPNKFTLTVSADSHMTAFLERVFSDETIRADGNWQVQTEGKSLNRELIKFNPRRLTKNQDQIKQLKKFYQAMKYDEIVAGGKQVRRAQPLTDDEVLRTYGPDLMTLFVFAREIVGPSADEAPTPQKGQKAVAVKTAQLIKPDGTPADGLLFINDPLSIKVELENSPAGKEIYAQFTFQDEQIGYPVKLTSDVNTIVLFDEDTEKPGEWAEWVGIKEATGPVTVTLIIKGADTPLAGTTPVASTNQVRIKAGRTSPQPAKKAKETGGTGKAPPPPPPR